MSALRGAFSVMVRDFLFHEIVGGTDPGGNYGMVCAIRSHRCHTFLRSYAGRPFFRDSVCLFLHTGTALDCAGGRKPDDSDFVYGSGTAGKRAVEKEVRAV